ncbi:hypothetical protein MNBD_NITROSPIRAE03-968 [hydrothermal vent metagenome]|uniref:Uncharacterized protein n=1 Tax=hydrothermal vent metagenome TaxID=652676 RepID=A0A3B1CRZ8_9ZZZZ
MTTFKVLTRVFLIILLAVFITACGSSSDDGETRCDVVANAEGPAFLKVINHLETGLSWVIQEYAFGADMKPGECTIFGVSAGTHTVELTQCYISDNSACSSNFGTTKTRNFSVADGETYTIDVTEGFF